MDSTATRNVRPHAGLAALGALLLAGPFAAPAVAQPQLPSYAHAEQPARPQPPNYARADETIGGTISGFDGKYGLLVRDNRGFIDRVQLHDGTIINPTGLRLAVGMSVTIRGRSEGPSFAAYQIDTPYQLYPPAYEYPEYPAYPAYVYPYYGYYWGGPYWRRW